MCTYCHNTGHTIETCYRKYGFPIGNNDSHTNVFEMQNQAATHVSHVEASMFSSIQNQHQITNQVSDPHVY